MRAAARPQAPIQRVRTPTGDPAWLVTGYDDVKALLSDPRLGRSHPDPDNAARMSRSAIFGGPIGDPETEAAEHARMRRLLAPSFSARQMNQLRPRVAGLVSELLDDLMHGSPPADFHQAVSFPLPALVICELLGVPVADRDDFRRWSDDAAHNTDTERSHAGLMQLWQYMGELVQRKRSEPADDVISSLVNSTDQHGSADVDGVAMLGAGLLFAGHETTVAAIDRGVTLLLTNADQRDALTQNPSLVPAAVEEILRSSLPVPTTADAPTGGLPRYAKTDVDFGGVTVAAGDLVLLGLDPANHDPQHFPDPERFDVSRTPNPHLSFGHGPRFCIGAPLARIELRELFAALLDLCPDMTLAVPVGELHARDELLTGGLSALPVTWPASPGATREL